MPRIAGWAERIFGGKVESDELKLLRMCQECGFRKQLVKLLETTIEPPEQSVPAVAAPVNTPRAAVGCGMTAGRDCPGQCEICPLSSSFSQGGVTLE